MVPLIMNLLETKALVVARMQQVGEDERRATERERRATEDGRRARADKSRAREESGWLTELLVEVERSIANAKKIGGLDGETVVPAEGGEVAASSADDPVAARFARLDEIFGEDFRSLMFLTPDNDEKTGEPKYPTEVVAGKGSNRNKALAAAQVYGRKLREPALAEAIFKTGETKAADAASVRASLGVLVRYGQEWERERGYLVYRGEHLEPDKVTILRLAAERDEKKRQS